MRVVVVCNDHIACTIDACREESETCVHTPPDVDADGHLDASCLLADGSASGDDCDDSDPARFPGAPEICDHNDEDCDLNTVGDKDGDGDGFVDENCSNSAHGGEVSGGDCDDALTGVHPNVPEVCNDLDDDCDGMRDEGLSVRTWPDNDRDGFGDPVGPIVDRCLIGEFRGWSLNDYDCDDTSARRHPGANCP